MNRGVTNGLRAGVLACVTACGALLVSGPCIAAGPESQPSVADSEQPADAARRISPPTGRRAVQAATNSKTSASPQGGATAWWTTCAALALVLALILGAGQVLRRYAPAAPGSLPPDVLHWMGKRRIDSRHAIHLVRCGSRLLILGASPQGLTALAEITDPTEVDALTGLCRSHAPSPFARGFNSLLRTNHDPDSGENEAEPAETPAARLAERLHAAAPPRGERLREQSHG